MFWRLILFSTLCIACSSAAQNSPSPSDPAAMGASLFKAKTCYSCHTIGNGRLAGPDLKGLFDRRSEDWVRRHLSDPIQMTQNDPIGIQLKQEYGVQMPKLQISPTELEALIAYLKQATAVTPSGATFPPPSR